MCAYILLALLWLIQTYNLLRWIFSLCQWFPLVVYCLFWKVEDVNDICRKTFKVKIHTLFVGFLFYGYWRNNIPPSLINGFYKILFVCVLWTIACACFAADRILLK